MPDQVNKPQITVHYLGHASRVWLLKDAKLVSQFRKDGY